MNERVALITGGAKGIGRGIALDLASRHWKIAICYRTSEAEAQKTALAITERGGQALAVRCDVSNPVAAHDLAAQIERTWGRIDVLVNGDRLEEPYILNRSPAWNWPTNGNERLLGPGEYLVVGDNQIGRAHV